MIKYRKIWALVIKGKIFTVTRNDKKNDFFETTFCQNRIESTASFSVFLIRNHIKIVIMKNS